MWAASRLQGRLQAEAEPSPPFPVAGRLPAAARPYLPDRSTGVVARMKPMNISTAPSSSPR